MPRQTTTTRTSFLKGSRRPHRHAPRDEAAARHEYYELILQCIGEGVHGIDADGRITFVNQAAATMLGAAAEDLMGQQQHPLIHHSRANGTPYPESECPILAAVREGRVFRQDGDVFWRTDGTSFPVDYIATPITQACRGTVRGHRSSERQ